MPQITQSPTAALAHLRANVGVPQRLDVPVIAERDEEWTSRGRVALRLATEEVARCRADHARAAAAARLLDEARVRWVAARRRERERAAEAEADDRPWPGAG
jgi:hypothetical protein